MKIAVMGAGGTGGYFGGRLARAGLDVTFVARGKHLEALRARGLQVQSTHGDFTLQPAQATDNPAEIGPVDVILFCVKTYDALTAAQQMKPLVGAQTVIIPTLNGIDHLAKIEGVVGEGHVLGGVAHIASNVIAPGVVKQIGALRNLTFGEAQGGVSARCTARARSVTMLSRR